MSSIPFRLYVGNRVATKSLFRKGSVPIAQLGRHPLNGAGFDFPLYAFTPGFFNQQPTISQRIVGTFPHEFREQNFGATAGEYPFPITTAAVSATGGLNIVCRMIADAATRALNLPQGEYGEPWVAGASSAWAGRRGDAACVVSGVRDADFNAHPSTQPLPLFRVPEPWYRKMHFHRARLDAGDVYGPCLAASITEPHYRDAAGLPPGNNTLSTLTQILPSVATLALPHQWSHTTMRIGCAYITPANEINELASVILFDRNIYAYYDLSTPRPPAFFSAIVRDARDNSEHLVSALIRLFQVQDNQYGQAYSLSAHPGYGIEGEGTGVTPTHTARAEYVQIALLSAETAALATAGYNTGIVRAAATETPLFALQGFATDNYRAFAADYEQWDFAATAEREFRSVAIPSYSSSFPPSHLDFDSPQYYRPQFPDVPGIGSPSSMLADRELVLDESLTPLYEPAPEGFGVTRPGLTKKAVSFVCLKSYSLLHSGIQSSTASCLVPLHSLAHQETFRFSGKNISGTTVRFEPVSQRDGLSFGRQQRADSIPAFDSTPATYLARYEQLQQPLAASDSWENYPMTNITFTGEIPIGLIIGAYSFVKRTVRSVPGSASAQVYEYVSFNPPRDGVMGPNFRVGGHHRRYLSSQAFTRHAPYDERGFVAGSLVDNMLNSGQGSPYFDIPFVLDFVSTAAGDPKSPLAPATALPMPVICGMDYECGRFSPGGVKFAAGVFGYNGAGPVSTTRVPYVGRGTKATATVSQFFAFNDLSGNGNAEYEINFEPLEVSGQIDVTLDTKEASVWVQWSASLQGVGPHRRVTPSQVSDDIDAHDGHVMPWFYCSTDRVSELQPVLIADLFVAARGAVSVQSEWSFPEELNLPSSYAGIGGTPLDESLVSNHVFAQNAGGDYYYHYSQGPQSTQGPVAVAKPPSQGVQLRDKKPMHAGTFIFNRTQTSQLLAGESVSPTHWLEYDEDDARSQWPMLMRWHNDGFGTIKPVFRLSFA